MRKQPVDVRKAYSLILITMISAAMGIAADLRPETLQKWDGYISVVDARNREHLARHSKFLASDSIPGQVAKMREGEIVISPAEVQVPIKIPAGLIHDWVGSVFFPNKTIDDVLRVIRDYDSYSEFYKPEVVKSKTTVHTDEKDQYSLVMTNKSAVGKTALDCDYQTNYVKVDEHRWYSISDSTRIQEISEYGTRSQHILPENHGTGLIWRLHTLTRFEERDGGVYVEVEAVALSRDIPAGVRWMVEPMVRRVSKSALNTSLQATESALISRPGQSLNSSSDQTCSASSSGCATNQSHSATISALMVP